jgi:hypothetical protein
MRHPFPPLSIFLEIGGASIPAQSFSESGLSLVPGSVPAASREALRSGSHVQAYIRLEADGCSDRYSVTVRLASRTTAMIEVAFRELPSEARLRLRHATRSMAEVENALEKEESAAEGDPAGKHLGNGRRLALGESHSVWGRTVARRAISRFSRLGAPDREEAAAVTAIQLPPVTVNVIVAFEILLILVLTILVIGGV